MRVEDWPARLAEVIARHERLPARYGVSDCFTFPMDVVAALTGDDPWGDARDYETEGEAARALVARGFDDVGDAFAAVLKEIPNAFAGRGDIGVVEIDGTVYGVVCVGLVLLCKRPDGRMLRLPRGRLARSFRVE